MQGCKNVVEDVVGKDREDAADDPKKDTSKSASVEETGKVNTFEALLSFCSNIVTLLTVYHYIICLSVCII